jgi:chromosome segregation ATPase
MTPFEIRHRRRKGEDLRAWVVRAITTECESDIPGVKEDMIEEALAFYRGRVAEHVEGEERARAETEIRHLRARLAELTRQYAEIQARYTTLKDSLPSMISVREAEEARLGAFRMAIFKAAELAEDDRGPNQLSVWIEDLPEPKPKWTK